MTFHPHFTNDVVLQCLCLVTLTQFEQPAFSVRVKEGVSQIIAVIFRDFEGLILDALIQVLQESTDC